MSIVVVSSSNYLNDVLSQHVLFGDKVTGVASIQEIPNETSVVVLDQAIDGSEVAAAIADVPVIRIGGGGMAKPISLTDLVRDIHRCLDKEMVLTIGGLFLDTQKELFVINGQSLHITQKETKMLSCLMRSYPKEISQEDLLKSIWKQGAEEQIQALQTHMHRLRQKLSCDVIKTTAKGYVLSVGEMESKEG